MTGSAPSSLPPARRALVYCAVVSGFALFLAFLWFAADLLLLVFAGVLLSIFLRGMVRALRGKTGLGAGVSLALVSVSLVLLTGGVVWLVAGQVGTQLSELQQQLPKALDNLRMWIERSGWAREALHSLPSPGEWFASRGGTVIARFTGAASTTLSAIVNFVLIGVIGLYLASQPGFYSAGLKRLIPIRARPRAAEVLDAVDDALWRWLIGRFGLMLLNAAFTSAGLFLLGVPFALTLGLLAGLLNFIPNIGPWIAAAPAVLVALLESPWEGLYTALLYLALQSIDGYILTPLVDRRSVELPPVLTITAQVLLGAAFGFMGILLASPLTTTAMIAVKMLYVEDALGDRGVEERK